MGKSLRILISLHTGTQRPERGWFPITIRVLGGQSCLPHHWTWGSVGSPLISSQSLKKGCEFVQLGCCIVINAAAASHCHFWHHTVITVAGTCHENVPLMREALSINTVWGGWTFPVKVAHGQTWREEPEGIFQHIKHTSVSPLRCCGMMRRTLSYWLNNLRYKTTLLLYTLNQSGLSSIRHAF